MAIIKLILAGILALGQILAPVGGWISTFGEDAYFTDWSATDTYGEDDYIELKKEQGKDFVVLNFADVQLDDAEQYDKEGVYTQELIKKLVAENEPDLITLTGDNAWGTMAYIELIKLIDSFGIPWAPVMGNHDGQGCMSEFWVAYLLDEAENCLFRFGPKDMGYGNYIINVTENGKIVHTFFMMDTHNNRKYELEDGTTVEDYDHIWERQMEWYKWAVEGNKALAGYNVPSTVMMHIPVVEYLTGWEAYAVGQDVEPKMYYGPLDNKWAPLGYGSRYEFGGFPYYTDKQGNTVLLNNGFFDLCKQLDSTKDIVVGHDHVNDYSVYYEGIRLTYALKTGFGSYWQSDLIGGTTLHVNSNGEMNHQHHHYNLEENGWDIVDD